MRLQLRTRSAAAVLVVALAVASDARANPPFINILYPPSGMSAPHEDPAAPHALPTASAREIACQENGEVKLALTISADGGVSEARVTQSSGYADLDASAVAQARKWRYQPATKDGAPTAVQISTTLAFQPETRAPNFNADCSSSATQAAAEAIAHGQ